MSVRRYADRVEAGDVLASHLLVHARNERPVVLGLPRGGVPVAARVALALGGALDVVIVRKLGVPGRPELAMGAIAGVGDGIELVRNDGVVAAAGVGPEAFEAAYAREVEELHRREAAYRAGRPPVDVTGRTVLVVDDGLATGATMLVSLTAVRRRRPATLVAAVPVGTTAACDVLRAQADVVVCVSAPARLRAVGEAYQDFRPTSDHEVRRLLAARAAAPPPVQERRSMTSPPLEPTPAPPGPGPTPGPLPTPGPSPDPGPGPMPGPDPVPPGPGPAPGPEPGPPGPPPGPIT